MKCTLLLFFLVLKPNFLYSQINCNQLLSYKEYVFIGYGASNLTFANSGLVYRVPYQNHDVDSFTLAKEEESALHLFHQIIKAANITEFRPLKNISVSRLLSPSLRKALKNKSKKNPNTRT